MKKKPVIVTDRGAEPCQECLVKWARNRILLDQGERYLCNQCAKPKKPLGGTA